MAIFLFLWTPAEPIVTFLGLTFPLEGFLNSLLIKCLNSIYLITCHMLHFDNKNITPKVKSEVWFEKFEK